MRGTEGYRGAQGALGVVAAHFPVAPGSGHGEGPRNTVRGPSSHLAHTWLTWRASGEDPDQASALGLASTPASLRCSTVIGVGAPVSGSNPEAVFGKAMTSRMESVPARSMQIRSQP